MKEFVGAPAGFGVILDHGHTRSIVFTMLECDPKTENRIREFCSLRVSINNSLATIEEPELAERAKVWLASVKGWTGL